VELTVFGAAIKKLSITKVTIEHCCCVYIYLVV